MTSKIGCKEILTVVAVMGVLSAGSAEETNGPPSSADAGEAVDAMTNSVSLVRQVEAPAFRVGLDYWTTTGEGDWQTAFSVVDPVFGTLSGKSLLEWDDLDSELLVVTADITLSRLFRISGRYGSGSIDGGVSTDKDWATVPSIGMYDFLFSESVNDADGDTALYDITLHCAISPLFKKLASKVDIDVFVGYHYYEDELNMQNAVQTVIDGEPVYIPFSEVIEETYDSDYAFYWEGISVGTRIRVPLTSQFDISARIALMVQTEYEGEGYWNLRDDFRSTPPNFIQSADSGEGTQLSLGVSYRPWKHVGFRLGYETLEWTAEDGHSTIFVADGSTESTDLVEVNSSRSGVTLGVFGQL